MQQCLAELRDSDLPADFKLAQVRSLLRYLREVSSLVNHVKSESGFGCDTTAYLEILCAKEDSNLYRRVSDTRILKQVCQIEPRGQRSLPSHQRALRKCLSVDVNLSSPTNGRGIAIDLRVS